MPKPKPTKAEPAKIERIQAIARAYGDRSFQNYAQIRSLAETVRDGFCKYIGGDGNCVFLVPPEGAFKAENAQSAAFSVAGQGYLPLQPIAFGLAVRVSGDKDFMRLVMQCRKEGDTMFVSINKKRSVRVPMPVTDGGLQPLLEHIEMYIVDFFQDSIDEYDNGDYGSPGIGFDILRVAE